MIKNSRDKILLKKDKGEENHLGAYAVLNHDNSQLTFYYDTYKEQRGGLSIGPFGYEDIRWNGYAADIRTVIFDDSFAYYTSLESTAHWFRDCKQLREIIGIIHLRTSNVKDMSNMFAGCICLKELNVSNFNTINVKNMAFMFYRCSALKKIEVHNFETVNVTNMESMFDGCSALNTLDVSGFDTRKVKNLAYMFNGCSDLVMIDMCDSDHLKVAIFCVTIDDDGFHTDSAYNMSGMFRNCKSLKQIDISNFNTSEVMYMNNMFEGCSSIESLDLSMFATDGCVDMNQMFSGCSKLKTIYVSPSWKTSVRDDGRVGMFNDCVSLVGGNGTAYRYSANDLMFAQIDKTDQLGYFTEKIVSSET